MESATASARAGARNQAVENQAALVTIAENRTFEQQLAMNYQSHPANLPASQAAPANQPRNQPATKAAKLYMDDWLDLWCAGWLVCWLAGVILDPDQSARVSGDKSRILDFSPETRALWPGSKIRFAAPNEKFRVQGPAS